MENTKTFEQLEEENIELKHHLKTLIQYSKSVEYWLNRYRPLEMTEQKQTFKHHMEKVKLANNFLVAIGEDSQFAERIVHFSNYPPQVF